VLVISQTTSTVAFATAAIVRIWLGPCVVVEPMRNIALVDMMCCCDGAPSVSCSRGSPLREKPRVKSSQNLR